MTANTKVCARCGIQHGGRGELCRDCRDVQRPVKQAPVVRTTSSPGGLLDLAKACGDPVLAAKADKIGAELLALKKAVKLHADIKIMQAELDKAHTEYNAAKEAI